MRNYLLLTPGPLSTSETVKEAMLQDWCTWDKDYNEGIVTVIGADYPRNRGGGFEKSSWNQPFVFGP